MSEVGSKSDSFNDSVRLSSESKQKVRARLLEEIEAFPYRPELASVINVILKERSFVGVQHPSRRVRRLAAFIVVFVLLITGSGVTFAAERSLPGDTLYPIKVGVTEEVRARFQLTPEKRAWWDERRAERRLQEALKLASNGRINIASGVDLGNRFTRHLDALERGIHSLELSGDMVAVGRLSSFFAATLDAHNRVLTRMGEEKAGTRISLMPLSKQVKDNSSVFEERRQKLEKRIVGLSLDSVEQKTKNDNGIKIIASERLSSISQIITVLRQTLELNKAALPAEFIASAETKIDEVEKLRVTAEARFIEGKYSEAFGLANQANFICLRTKLLIEARAAFNIQVDLSSALFPLTLPLENKLNTPEIKRQNIINKNKKLFQNNNSKIGKGKINIKKEKESEIIFPFTNGTIVD